MGVGMTADETLRLAENWTRRHSQEPPRNDDANNVIDDDGSGSCHDSDDSRNHISYQEYDSEGKVNVNNIVLNGLQRFNDTFTFVDKPETTQK